MNKEQIKQLWELIKDHSKKGVGLEKANFSLDLEYFKEEYQRCLDEKNNYPWCFYLFKGKVTTDLGEVIETLSKRKIIDVYRSCATMDRPENYALSIYYKAGRMTREGFCIPGLMIVYPKE